MFTELAEAYQIKSLYISCADEMDKAIKQIALSTGPILLEVGMLYATEYRPRLAFGKKLNEQVPIIILN